MARCSGGRAYGARGAAQRTTRAPAHPPRRVRAPASTAAGDDRRAARRRMGEDVARHQRDTGKTTRVTQGSGGGSVMTRTGWRRRQVVAASGSGDVYAGHDGNVYQDRATAGRSTRNGGWYNTTAADAGERDAQGPAGADRARGREVPVPPTTSQLDRDSRRARQARNGRATTAATTAAPARHARAATGRAPPAATADGGAKAKGRLISKSPGGLEINPPPGGF